MNQTLNDDVESGIPPSKKEALQKAQLVIKSPRLVYQTCQDYFDDGIMESGNFTIDPDLEGPISSFMVYCDFELGNYIMSRSIYVFATISLANHYHNVADRLLLEIFL